MDLLEIMKSLYMLVAIFCYMGGFVFWVFILLLINDIFDQRKFERIERKQNKEDV